VAVCVTWSQEVSHDLSCDSKKKNRARTCHAAAVAHNQVYVEMGMLFHIYYVTLSNPSPLLSSNTSQKLSFDKLLTSIDANFKYISPGFDYVQFDGDLLKIFYDYYKTPSFGQILRPSEK
jgi:hypothetical protein